MSGQDDLFRKDADQNQDISLSDIDGPVVEPEMEESDSLVATQDEASVEDEGSPRTEDDASVAGEGLAASEIRVVDPPPKQRSSSTLLLVVLLLVVLLGGVYALFTGGFLMTAPPANNVQTAKVAAKRYAIDRDVKVEVVEQQQVATVEEVKEPKPRQIAPEKTSAGKDKIPAQKEPMATADKESSVVAKTPAYQVLVGPYLSKSTLKKAAQQLRELGYETEVTKGRGKVGMTRLLEGIYPLDEAKLRLQEVKGSISDAFMVPTGDKMAIYVGSFVDAPQAKKYADELALQGVNVTPIATDVVLNGKMLVAVQGAQQEVQAAAAKIKAAGLTTQIKKK